MKPSEPFFVDNWNNRMRKSAREQHKKRSHRHIPQALRHGKCDDCDRLDECKLREQGFTDICHQITMDVVKKPYAMTNFKPVFVM